MNKFIKEEPIKSYLKVIHLAMSYGVIIMILLFHFFLRNIDLNHLLQPLDLRDIVISLIAAVSLLISYRVPQTIHIDDLQEQNRVRHIMRWGLLEAGVLVSAIGYFALDGHPLLFLIAAIMAVLLYLAKPAVI